MKPLAVAVVVGLILFSSTAIVVVVPDPFGSDDSSKVAAVISPTKTPGPSVTFYPTPFPTSTEQGFVTVNGADIPMPAGAIRAPVPPQLPDSYSYPTIDLTKGASWLSFRENGWLQRVDIEPQDAADFAATLDGLAAGAEPAVIGPVTIHIPKGMIYRTPMLIGGCSHAAGWIGPPVESPQNHIFRIGESYLAFGVCDGTFIRDIQPADEEAFRPVLEALGLPVYG